MNSEENLKYALETGETYPNLSNGDDKVIDNITPDTRNNILEKTSPIKLGNMPEQQVDTKIQNVPMSKAGYVTNKFLNVLVVVLFIGSCVFLGYELVKVNELKPLIQDKYFS